MSDKTYLFASDLFMNGSGRRVNFNGDIDAGFSEKNKSSLNIFLSRLCSIKLSCIARN